MKEVDDKWILIVKLGAIGDVAMLLPATYRLYQAGYRIHWVCGKASHPLLTCCPWIETVVADDTALLTGSLFRRLVALSSVWRTIGGRRYAGCAVLYYDWRYRALVAPVLAKAKLYLSRSNRPSRLIPGRSHASEYVRVLEGLVGKMVDGEVPSSIGPVPMRLMSLPPPRRPKATGRLRAVLVPGGAKNLLRVDHLRRWPLESYAALARALLRRDFEVVLVGGPDDRWAWPAFEGLEVVDELGTMTLPETLSLLASSDVVVSHDTGPLHLAGMTGASIVALFGPTDPHVFLPRRADSLALWGGKEMACRPCYDGSGFAPCQYNGCMSTLTPAVVVEHVDRAILARGSEQSRTWQIVEVA